jgi:hypothetical protein
MKQETQVNGDRSVWKLDNVGLPLRLFLPPSVLPFALLSDVSHCTARLSCAVAVKVRSLARLIALVASGSALIEMARRQFPNRIGARFIRRRKSSTSRLRVERRRHRITWSCSQPDSAVDEWMI